MLLITFYAIDIEEKFFKNRNKSMDWNILLNNNRNSGDIQFVWYFHYYLNNDRNSGDVIQVAYLSCKKTVQSPIIAGAYLHKYFCTVIFALFMIGNMHLNKVIKK